MVWCLAGLVRVWGGFGLVGWLATLGGGRRRRTFLPKPETPQAPKQATKETRRRLHPPPRTCGATRETRAEARGTRPGQEKTAPGTRSHSSRRFRFWITTYDPPGGGAERGRSGGGCSPAAAWQARQRAGTSPCHTAASSAGKAITTHQGNPRRSAGAGAQDASSPGPPPPGPAQRADRAGGTGTEGGKYGHHPARTWTPGNWLRTGILWARSPPDSLPRPSGPYWRIPNIKHRNSG